MAANGARLLRAAAEVTDAEIARLQGYGRISTGAAKLYLTGKHKQAIGRIVHLARVREDNALIEQGIDPLSGRLL